MTDDLNDHQLHARVRDIVAASINGLTDDDFAYRLALCREHDDHVHLSRTDHDDVIQIRWGGHLLASIRLDHLLSNVPLSGYPVAEPPDIVPADLAD